MIMLIDYDNLRSVMSRRGVEYVIQTILDEVGVLDVSQGHRIRARLYGGWFYKNSISWHAQKLLRQLPGGQLLKMFGVSGTEGRSRVQVSVELARSLACDPKKELTHTFRPRSAPPNLFCRKMPFDGCAYPGDCEIKVIQELVRDKWCPIAKCKTSLSEVLGRPEQKLVDSMIVADLIHYARNPKAHLVVVSADDDLWPGIRAALLNGARISHVVPRRHLSHAHLYSELRTRLYSRLSI